MSYCRFSSDDYQCDVYCFADVGGGFTTYVANNRPVLDRMLPPEVPFDTEHADEWMCRYHAIMAWTSKAKRAQIGLPYDGQRFNDPTAIDAADRLQMLKDTGYNVPQYAIDALRAEADES